MSGDVVVSVHRGPDEELVLAVSDSGRGITENDRSRIFEVRERGVNSGSEPGSGIGLSVCREIVKRLDGEIECASRAGGGSKFTVRIGGIQFRDGQPGQSAALSGIRCTLDLDRPLERSLAGFIERLGIDTVNTAPRLDIRIRKPDTDHGIPGSGVEITAVQGAWKEAVRLAPPVLASSLEEALLGVVLAWRWRQLRSSDMRG